MAEAGSWKDGKRTSTEYFVRRPGDDVAIASEIIDPANDDAPSEANARLIAAAPYLLAALEGIASATCEKWEMSYADFKEQFMPWARNIALATLKKAKGDS